MVIVGDMTVFVYWVGTMPLFLQNANFSLFCIILGDVIVIYLGDKRSQHLQNDELYNQNLGSVKSHPDLKELVSRQRFLSVYEKFSAKQKRHIADIVLKGQIV